MEADISRDYTKYCFKNDRFNEADKIIHVHIKDALRDIAKTLAVLEDLVYVYGFSVCIGVNFVDDDIYESDVFRLVNTLKHLPVNINRYETFPTNKFLVDVDDYDETNWCLLRRKWKIAKLELELKKKNDPKIKAALLQLKAQVSSEYVINLYIHNYYYYLLQHDN
ncbi:hypothetical protein AsGV133 [Agrotis segetum granulovirus]|uniref:Uncharacterized protein n=1 Tax=Agrotis segetum granulosis virus TaxID=10464 RepID=A0A023MIP2_GVAS|nr:hypothetical protein AsGV133 [Agrotis segetum granulovirus]AHN92169.1 hypothetical protein AsGV130 [Agrotis segetum granulovirus]AKN63407.1 hypothetical protein AsGV133 [Agrotis segetum granulovirus]